MEVYISLVVLALVPCTAGFYNVTSNEAAPPKLWALLVAGSNGYYNYRHQADICHAYQIMHKHGIPDERIVVMMYDDIASSSENPTPGVVINRPKGEDVYQGTLKDYTGEDVTPENFLKILQGDSASMKGIGSGKVIKSGPNDHIFVNFADHGAPGLVAFPTGELYAKDLNQVINTMYKKKQFAKMVFYVEACESGSMFKDLLPKNINVFATTAANDHESSYACYWDDQRNTYLGDVYSVMWMEDSDLENLNKETLQKQYLIVKNETNTSQVTEFGDRTISKMMVGEFQGMKKTLANLYYPTVPLEPVESSEVPVATLKRKLSRANSAHEETKLKKQLDTLLKHRDYLKRDMEQIVRRSVYTDNQVKTVFDDKQDLRNHECHKDVTSYFSQNCYPLSKNAYALRYMYLFVNLCEYGVTDAVMKSAMDKVCDRPTMVGVH